MPPKEIDKEWQDLCNDNDRLSERNEYLQNKVNELKAQNDKAKQIIGRILSDSEIWQYKLCITKELVEMAENFLKEDA